MSPEWSVTPCAIASHFLVNQTLSFYFSERLTHSWDRKRSGWDRNECSQHRGNSQVLESSKGNSSLYFSPGSLDSPSPSTSVCPEMETNRHFLTLNWRDYIDRTTEFWIFQSNPRTSDRWMLSCWLSLTLWSLSKSCFVSCDFYASTDVWYWTICKSTVKVSYKFEVLKPYV